MESFQRLIMFFFQVQKGQTLFRQENSNQNLVLDLFRYLLVL